MPDEEMREIQAWAQRENLPVGEWVRRTLREARSHRSGGDPNGKIQAVREAVGYSFPTADIEQMNREIEQGYLGEF